MPVLEEDNNGEDFLNLGGHKRNSRAYLSAFNFQGTDQ